MFESATVRFQLDEGNLDDWVSLQLLLEDPGLPSTLLPNGELEQGQLVTALRSIVQSLKENDAIAFSSPLGESTSNATIPNEEEGSFDVAKVLVEGKVDKLVGKKDKKAKEKKDGENGDLVEVPHPLDSEAEPIKIGLARHRYLEPLFDPKLLSELAPSASATAALLGFDEYETRTPLYAGIQELMGVVAGQAVDLEARRLVWEGIVIVSSGKVARIKCECIFYKCLVVRDS